MKATATLVAALLAACSRGGVHAPPPAFPILNGSDWIGTASRPGGGRHDAACLFYESPPVAILRIVGWPTAFPHDGSWERSGNSITVRSGWMVLEMAMVSETAMVGFWRDETSGGTVDLELR